MFWVGIRNMKALMGKLEYQNLATLALSIPADSKRMFSLVRRIKTETLSALIGCHFNKTVGCCELTKFDESLLSKAKGCTMERHLS